MPVLKCIGGTNDGEYFDIGLLRIGEVFHIPQRNKIASIATKIRPVQTVFTEYTIRALFFQGKETLRFLAPREWTDMQAVEHQFNK